MALPRTFDHVRQRETPLEPRQCQVGWTVPFS